VKLAALVVGVSLVGVAFAVGSLGADGPKQLGARVGALLDEPDSGPVTAEEATASVKQPSPGAGDPATSASLAASSLVPSSGMDEAPRVTIVDAHTLANGDVGARISLDWSPLLPAIGAGAGPGVATETRLERWLEDETWSVVATADAGDPVEVAVGPGRRYLFRVRVLDASGTDAVSSPVGLELDVRDPRSAHLALEPAPDGWITKRGNTIKRRLVATVPDASLSTEFSGSSVALVGPAGPDRGAIGVRIDGGPWSQDDLRTWATAARTLVFSQDLESGSHSLDLRAEADGVALDAVVILRTEEA